MSTSKVGLDYSYSIFMIHWIIVAIFVNHFTKCLCFTEDFAAFWSINITVAHVKNTGIRNSCFNIYHKVYKCPHIWTYRRIIHGLQVLVLCDLIELTTVCIAEILFAFLFCLHPLTCWQCFSECNPEYHQPSLPQGHIVGSCSSWCPSGISSPL